MFEFALGPVPPTVLGGRLNSALESEPMRLNEAMTTPWDGRIMDPGTEDWVPGGIDQLLFVMTTACFVRWFGAAGRDPR